MCFASRPPGEIPELGEKIDQLPEIDPIILQEVPAQLLVRRRTLERQHL